MKALTLWRPWAWCVAHAGKDIENRTWEPPRSVIDQRIAIHAGKKYDGDAAVHLYNLGLDVPTESRDPSGAVVAVVTVKGFTRDCDSPWFGGPIGWILSDVVALPEPVRCRGAQGLWTLPPDVESRVRHFLHNQDSEPCKEYGGENV